MTQYLTEIQHRRHSRLRYGVATLSTLLWLTHGPAILAEVTVGAEPNVELRELFEGDQEDRRGNMHDADWEKISRRDAERRVRTRDLVDAGEARTGADFYHAAMVFQHGEGVDDIRQARDWAARAVELSQPGSEVYDRAKWLFAAATDRHLHRQGKPQIYGTQFKRSGRETPWTMEPFDRDAVTSEERAAHGVPAISEQEARLEKMNQELRERGLLTNEADGKTDE